MNETDFCEITEFFGRIPRKFNFLGSDIYSSPFFSFKYLKTYESLLTQTFYYFYCLSLELKIKLFYNSKFF
jgi:hypothetical protein